MRRNDWLGIVYLVLSFLIPFVTVFLTRNLIKADKQQAVENTPARVGFWISLVLTLFAVVIVVVSWSQLLFFGH